jgi:hypothetical protein
MRNIHALKSEKLLHVPQRLACEVQLHGGCDDLRRRFHALESEIDDKPSSATLTSVPLDVAISIVSNTMLHDLV